ncbi:MAG: LytTR family transcriptional regulator DNA-binding domain-containing protein [Myxococcales bacterium]|nr:LytTR family transcriptional regulator DNA-binding domain-containing protein [Myxococcales bacterium]
MPTPSRPCSQVLLHPEDGLRRVIDPQRIYYAEVVGGEVFIRLAGQKPRRDVRELGDLTHTLGKYGFVRIHHSYLVNPQHIQEIRRSKDNWEVKLAPPINTVLPVARRRLQELWAVFGE